MDYPFARLEAYRLRQGSGGAGHHRGGDGLERCYRILDDGVQFATYSDRFKTSAEGLFGGAPGASAEVLVERGADTIRTRQRPASCWSAVTCWLCAPAAAAGMARQACAES